MAKNRLSAPAWPGTHQQWREEEGEETPLM